MTKRSMIAVAVALSAVVAPATAGQARPHTTCVRTADITSISYPDDRTILFRMKTGAVKVWRNELPYACFGLKSEQGIAWNIMGGVVCEKTQIFSVLRQRSACRLGSFVPADEPRQDGWAAPPKS